MEEIPQALNRHAPYTGWNNEPWTFIFTLSSEPGRSREEQCKQFAVEAMGNWEYRRSNQEYVSFEVEENPFVVENSKIDFPSEGAACETAHASCTVTTPYTETALYMSTLFVCKVHHHNLELSGFVDARLIALTEVYRNHGQSERVLVAKPVFEKRTLSWGDCNEARNLLWRDLVFELSPSAYVSCEEEQQQLMYKLRIYFGEGKALSQVYNNAMTGMIQRKDMQHLVKVALEKLGQNPLDKSSFSNNFRSYLMLPALDARMRKERTEYHRKCIQNAQGKTALVLKDKLVKEVPG